MSYWNQIPLFRLIIPLLLGVVFAIYNDLNSIQFSIASVVLFSLLLLASVIKYIFTTYTNRWVFGFILYFLIFFIGGTTTQLKKPENETNHFMKYSAHIHLVTLNEDMIPKPNSFKAEVKVVASMVDSHWISTSGKAIVYFEKDISALEYGDQLVINGKWKAIESPTNPAQFNYKHFLYNSGVLAQQYVKPENWKNVQSSDEFSIIKLAFNYQKQLLSVLNSKFKGEELAVLSALLLGYKDLLDRETIMTYASSGAMHVLAVSGLHVGIIFIVLNSLLFFFDKIKYGNYIKALLLIILLWVYALITGLSPSVLRATTMFTFIIVGSSLKRQTNIYNTLAASAFVLILYNPYIILQVGFQLSYLAVLGIVYVQPKLYKLYQSDYWIIDKIWIITTVSIAAQLATFPLGMYYFHQFPNYFLLSNLFVIPLATIIINIGIILLSMSFSTFLSYWLAYSLNKLLLFLNFAVNWVEQLPYSLTLGISITKVETTLIYLIILLFVTAVINKNFKNVRVSLWLTVLFVSVQIYEKIQMQKQHYFIVYDVPKNRAIDFVDANQNYFIASDKLNNDPSKMRFHIMHYRWERRVQKSTLIPNVFSKQNYYRNGNFIQFFDKNILLWDEHFSKPITPLFFDCIIVSTKVKLDLENIDCKQLIIDSSVPKYKWEEIKKECLKWDIPFYNVNTQGAYLFEIKT
jgi:competence protein ComEC